MKSILLTIFAFFLLVSPKTFGQIDLSILDNFKKVEHPPALLHERPAKPAPKDPETPEEYYEMASWAFEQRMTEYAIKNINEAIRLRPDFAKAFEFRGEIYSSLDRCSDAIKDLDIAISISPRMTDAYFGKADCKARNKQYREALSDIESILRIYAETNRKASLTELWFRGRLRFLLNDYKGAIQDFTDSDLGRSHHYARFFRGLAYMKSGDNANAIKDLTYVVDDLSIRDREFYGVKNEEYIREWISYYPYDEDPLATADSRLAKPCAKVGNSDIFAPENSASPDHWFIVRRGPYILPNRNIVFYFLGTLQEKDGDIESAIRSYTSSINSTLAQNSPARFRRGKLYLATGQFEPAVRDLSWVICSQKEPANAYLERGIALLMLGKDEIAQADFDKYLALNPEGESTLRSRIQMAKGLSDRVAERP